MKRNFGLIFSASTTAFLLLFALPACDLEDESEFRYIPVDEEEPPCECVCIDEIPVDDAPTTSTDPTDSTDPSNGHGGSHGKGNGKNNKDQV